MNTHKLLQGTLAALILSTTVAVCFAQAPRINRHPAQVRGILLRIDHASLVVSLRQKLDDLAEVAIQTDETTKFNVDGEDGTLTELKPGMEIVAPCKPAPQVSAVRMSVLALSPALTGTVVSSGDGKLTMAVTDGETEPKQTQVQTTEKTRVIIPRYVVNGAVQPGGTSNVDGLKAGMRVRVLPPSGSAEKIIATPADR